MGKRYEMKSIFYFFLSSDSHPERQNLFYFTIQNTYKKQDNCMDYNYLVLEFNALILSNGGTDRRFTP